MLFLYTSAMPGAPALSETSGTMINVLDACLVTGFNLQPLAGIEVIAGVATATVTAGHGLLRPVRCKISGHGSLNGLYPVTGTPSATQFTFSVAVPDGSYPGGSVSVAPAGFEKLYPDTNRGVYRSLDTLSTQTLWRVEQAGIYTHVSGYETMSDGDTGTGQFIKGPADARGARFIHGRSGDATPRPWWLVATESSVLIYVARYYADPAVHAACNGNFFGDFTPLYSADLFHAAQMYYDFDSVPPNQQSAPFCSTTHYMSLRRGIDGAAVGAWGLSATPFGENNAGIVGANAFIGPATDNKLVLSSVTVIQIPAGAAPSMRLPRGVIPNVLYCPFAMPDDSYYPAGVAFAGDAGTDLEGHYLYPINTGTTYGGTPSVSNRRTFIDVTELMA